MGKKKNMDATGFEAFTDEELCRALELLVCPDWLRERQVIISVLQVLDFTPEDVREQLDAGVQLNDGPAIQL